MPKMEPLSEKWKDKLTVIGVTKVTKTATDDLVMQFLKDNSIKFPIAKEKDGSISQAYSVSGIPAAAIVKGGKVIWRGHPNKLTDDFLTKLLG
jgi:methyl coenzyme M reductase beta subunit